MKVFLSWSGPFSEKVAVEFNNWLPKVNNLVKPFISGKIGKGERWSEKVSKELEKSDFGIIIVTPKNIKEPWIHFEAGAISNVFGEGSVCPFLFGVESSEIEGPLQQFQCALFEEPEIFELLENINNKLEPDLRLEAELLRAEFDMWWPKLKENLDEILEDQNKAIETRTGYEWLNTEKDLLAKQKAIDFKHNWIISQNLFNRVLKDDKSKNLLKKKIEKDVIFKFFTPKTSDLEDYKGAVEKLFEGKPEGNCTIVPVESKKFETLAVTDYIILFTKTDIDTPAHGFFELPLEGIKNLWMEVDKEAATKLVNRFKEVEKNVCI